MYQDTMTFIAAMIIAFAALATALFIAEKIVEKVQSVWLIKKLKQTPFVLDHTENHNE